MKTTIFTTAALIGAVLLPSLAFSKTVQGCEVIDMGGYSNKADPTCVFNHQPGGGGTPSGGTLQDLLDLLED